MAAPPARNSQNRRHWFAAPQPSFRACIGQPAIGARGRVVDEDVETAERLRQLAHCVVCHRGVRNICNPAVNSGARFLRGQLASRRLELPAIVVNQAEPRSFARENGGGRATDFPRAASDQGRTPS